MLKRTILFFVIFSFQILNAAEKTFVYCSEGSPSNFNPQMATDGPSLNASSQTVFSRLVDFKRGTTEIVPALAESWKISKDGLKYTFQLRKDAQFHTNFGFTPTRPLNVDDVIFSFKRQMDKENPYHKVSGGHYEYFEGMEMAKIIKSMNKVDAHTIEFVLNRNEAPFLANLAMDFASIHSHEYSEFLLAKKTPEKIDIEPIGTGPFVFESYKKDTLIRFKAFEKYWGGKPKIDKLVFTITTDPTVRFQKLKTGECHLIAEPHPADLENMKKTAKVKVLEKEGINVGYLALNTQKKPFDKIEVRQAIMHALNRENYLNSIYMGKASLAKNPIPPTMWSYNEKTEEYKHDLKKAKELLEKAGMKEGFETELWTLPVSRPYNPGGKKMGELMQADLAKIGIKVKLVSYDWPTYLEKSRKGEHAIIQLGWTGDNGDPDNFLNVLLGCASIETGSNVARWCYKPFNDAITEAKLTHDQSKRTELYKKAQGLFKEQVPWAPLAHARIFRGIRENVDGYVLHPLGREYFGDIEIK